MSEMNSLVEPLQDRITALEKGNALLRRDIDDLEMYSRRDCIRIGGVPEDRINSDAVVLDVANKLSIPLQPNHTSVSHRVGPKRENKPRQIIARITNYELKHKILKSSKNLRKISGMERVTVNQDLTKIRNKLAFEARQLVKRGKAKSTFVWDGKIFGIDHHDSKHKVQCPADMLVLLGHLGVPQDWLTT
jgi:hypothetical protein